MYISTQQEENQRENSDKPLGKNYGIKQEKTYRIEKKKNSVLLVHIRNSTETLKPEISHFGSATKEVLKQTSRSNKVIS